MASDFQILIKHLSVGKLGPIHAIWISTGASFYDQLRPTGEDISLPSGTLCSVFQTEMYAILQCLRSDDLITS